MGGQIKMQIFNDKEIKQIRLKTENKLIEENKTKYQLANELKIDKSSLYRVLNGTLINCSVLKKLKEYVEKQKGEKHD